MIPRKPQMLQAARQCSRGDDGELKRKESRKEVNERKGGP
jgi:hypothetical protein